MKELIKKIESYILKMTPGESVPIELKVSEQNRELFIEIGRLITDSGKNGEYTFSDDYKYLKRVR